MSKPSYEELEKRVKELEKEKSALLDVCDKQNESEEKYKQLFYNSIDMIFLRKAGSRQLIEFNDTACRKLGYTREELFSIPPDDLIHSRFRNKRYKTIEKLKANGHITVEREFITKGGVSMPVEVRSYIVAVQNKLDKKWW